MPEVLDIFTLVRSRLTNCTDSDGLLSARMRVEAGEVTFQQQINYLSEQGVIQSIHKDGVLLATLVAEDAEYDIVIDLGNLPGYFETYDSLIEASPAEVPALYRVWQSDTQLDNGYRAAVDLLKLLKTKGVVWTDDAFFVVEGKVVEFTLVYKSSDTVELPAVFIEIDKYLHDEQIDADTRWTFFRKALIRLFHDSLKDARLGLLLQNAKTVLDRAQEDYSLYLERYSFEDLLKNFEAKRLEFVSSLNQVLASIQTALIAVPLGFFLIAEKFKTSGTSSFQNLLVLLGGLAFFSLVYCLIMNQRMTLATVKLALDDFESDQKEKKTVKQERLLRLLKSAKAHYDRVKSLLTAVQVLTIAFAILLVVAFFWSSNPSLAEIVERPITTIIQVVFRISVLPQ